MSMRADPGPPAARPSLAAAPPAPRHPIGQLLLDALALVRRKLQPDPLLTGFVPEPVGPVRRALTAIEAALGAIEAQGGDEVALSVRT